MINAKINTAKEASFASNRFGNSPEKNNQLPEINFHAKLAVIASVGKSIKNYENILHVLKLAPQY